VTCGDRAICTLLRRHPAALLNGFAEWQLHRHAGENSDSRAISMALGGPAPECGSHKQRGEGSGTIHGVCAVVQAAPTWR